jgi:tetratricopeptide (TPR) repeat protein
MQTQTNALSEQYAKLIRVINEIGEQHRLGGSFTTAFQFWQQSEQLINLSEVRQIDQASFFIGYASFLIDVYFLNNRDEALMVSSVQRARQFAEASGDEATLAKSLLLSGKMRYFQCLLKGIDEYTEVRDYLQRASILCEKLGDDYDQAEVFFYTGLTYDRQQKGSPQAKDYYLRALSLAEQQDNKWAASEATRHLTDHSEGDERLNYARRSLDLRYEMQFKRALPSAQLLLSVIYIDRGDLEHALEYCQQAEKFTIEMDLQNYLVFVWITYGEIALRQQKPTEARASFEKGSQLAHQLNIAYSIAVADEKLKSLEK